MFRSFTGPLTNSHKVNKVYEDTYIVVLDGLTNLL